jgi:hypothetical protein
MTQTAPPSPAPTAEVNPLKAPSLTRRIACWLYEGTLLFGVIFGTGLFFYGLLFAIGHLAPSLLPLRDAFNNRFALQAFVFLLVLGQGPDACVEDLEHPGGRCPRPTAHPRARLLALSAVLAVAPAALGRWCLLQSAGGGACGDSGRLDRGVGPAVPVSHPAPVSSRCAGRYPVGSFQTRRRRQQAQALVALKPLVTSP